MPARFSPGVRALSTAVLALALSVGTSAQQADTPTRSRLDAQLFYQLLIGEIGLRSGQAGAAYEVILDAARRTKDDQLFRRATDIALHARAGEQALAAAKMWRSDVSQSPDAHRYYAQILIALNRASETVEPLRTLVSLTPEGERSTLIVNLPRFFSRLQDKQQIAGILSRALQAHAEVPATRAAVSVAMGRAWLIAADKEQALEMARRALSQDPADERGALFALEVLASVPQAESLVLDHLKANPKSNTVRMVYSRVLTAAQRYGHALVQLEAVTQTEPRLSAPWITLGALQLELRQPKQATASLQRYLALVQEATQKTSAPEAQTPEDDDMQIGGAERGLTQAWLMLAQAAEQQNDFKSAGAWLDKVGNSQQALDVLSRRASLMARQGKLQDARELIRRAPERTLDDARSKILAEVQLLRDAKKWSEVSLMLANANKKYPDDVELLYEQSMAAERLNRMEEMERLLRQVIELKPDHHHAHNALGYSLAARNLRLPEAKALIQKALEMAPNEPFITDSLGWVEYRMGNVHEALRLLRGAYQSRPDPEIAAHLGEVLWVNGHRDEARRVWREARSRDASNDVLLETLARLRIGDL